MLRAVFKTRIRHDCGLDLIRLSSSMNWESHLESPIHWLMIILSYRLGHIFGNFPVGLPMTIHQNLGPHQGLTRPGAIATSDGMSSFSLAILWQDHIKTHVRHTHHAKYVLVYYPNMTYVYIHICIRVVFEVWYKFIIFTSQVYYKII